MAQKCAWNTRGPRAPPPRDFSDPTRSLQLALGFGPTPATPSMTRRFHRLRRIFTSTSCTMSDMLLVQLGAPMSDHVPHAPHAARAPRPRQCQSRWNLSARLPFHSNSNQQQESGGSVNQVNHGPAQSDKPHTLSQTSQITASWRRSPNGQLMDREAPPDAVHYNPMRPDAKLNYKYKQGSHGAFKAGS